jgi:long-chain acyl-CoA synthetase
MSAKERDSVSLKTLLSDHLDDWLVVGNTVVSVLKESVARAAGLLLQCGVQRTDIVICPLSNDSDAIVRLLALWCIDVLPVVIGADSPPAELQRLCNVSGAAWIWRAQSAVPQPAAPTVVTLHAAYESGLFFVTSGSTGEPKLVFRSEASLLAEARRYRNGLGISSDDVVLIPLPIAHAYAMGVVISALLVGAQMILSDTTALGELVERMQCDATVLFLSPIQARLLANRASSSPEKIASLVKLRFAMVGAGPVDEATEIRFHSAFGIGLARNYGSTELGAVFAGLPPLPARCVGHAFPSVEYRIDISGAEGAVGTLWVRDVSGEWVDTGDLVVEDGTGNVTVLGRRSSSIRRGDRWISPIEIEDVLRKSGMVQDVYVRKALQIGTHNGNDKIAAEVVPAEMSTFDTAALRTYLYSHLSRHKVPDIIHVRKQIARNAQGKVIAKKRYVSGEISRITDAVRAYKKSELVLALYRTGVLQAMMTGGADTAEIAERCSLSLDAVESTLFIAAKLGLVTELPSSGCADYSLPSTTEDFIELEEILSRDVVNRETISDYLRVGESCRRFDQSAVPDSLRLAYARAMHGRHAQLRARFALSRLHLPLASRVLEISSGPGRYLEELLQRVPDMTGTLLQVGPLASQCSDAVRFAEGVGRICITRDLVGDQYDICVVDNAIHFDRAGYDLEWILNRTTDKGTVLIDDIFLPDDGTGSEIALDWFTHGGSAYMWFADLHSALQRLNVKCTTRRMPGDHLHWIAYLSRNKDDTY